MSRELVEVQFHDQTLTAVMHEGEAYVAMKPICESFGLDWDGQRKRIMRDDNLKESTAILTAVASDGIERDMVMLPLKYFYGWMFGVKPNMVKEEIRESLKKYRDECFNTLYNHFRPKETPRVISFQATDDVTLLMKMGLDAESAITRIREHYKEEQGYDVFEYLAVKPEDKRYFTFGDIVKKNTKGNQEWMLRILTRYGFITSEICAITEEEIIVVTKFGRMHCKNFRDKPSKILWSSFAKDQIVEAFVQAGQGSLLKDLP